MPATFDFLAGIVNKQDQQRFKRMVFRGSKGNALSVFMDIEMPMEDPVTGKFVKKVVFLLFFEAGGE